jgi:predicted heme/steroid binding protein
MLVYSISGYSQITLDHDNTNEAANDGLHPLLQTIHAMPAAYKEIIGVCQQLPPLAALQSLANEISDGTVTVATDGSVRSGDGTYSWIIDGSNSGVHLAGHAKAAQTGQDPTSMQMEVLGHLASLLVVKALIQTNGIIVVNWEIKLSGVIDNEAVLYQIQTVRLKGAGLCL